MNEGLLMFNVIVAMTFLGQCLNYYLIGEMHRRGMPMRDGHRYLFIGVLSGFAVTETIVSLQYPVYLLYVLLNLWGIYQLWGKRAE